jgi:peptidoglycan/xylan/chitin deacetylase (PgdA/CDA1 family)
MRGSRAVPALLTLLVVLGACNASADPTATPRASDPAPSSALVSEAPSAPASPSNDAVAPTAEPTPFAGTEHTVRAGESLTGIARLYGATLAQLQEWNADRYASLPSNPGIIEPGWVLIVSLEPGVTPAPTPPATPRPTSAPTGGAACTAGNRVAAGEVQVFRTIPNAGPGVALTFDMGGRMEPAADIMSFLVANQVCATIFATGVMSQTPQGQQVMAIIKAHPELFEIANHTMYHCDLARGGGGSPSTQPCTGSWSADRIRAEMTDAEAVLRAGTGQDPQPYWRPPYGSFNDAVLDAVASVGYTKTFMWDIDTVDWKPVSDGGPTAEQIASKVIGGSVNGSNVLFHLGGYETLDALRLIVPGLRDRGFTLTSLSDLLN